MICFNSSLVPSELAEARVFRSRARVSRILGREQEGETRSESASSGNRTPCVIFRDPVQPPRSRRQHHLWQVCSFRPPREFRCSLWHPSAISSTDLHALSHRVRESSGARRDVCPSQRVSACPMIQHSKIAMPNVRACLGGMNTLLCRCDDASRSRKAELGVTRHPFGTGHLSDGLRSIRPRGQCVRNLGTAVALGRGDLDRMVTQPLAKGT